MFCNQCGQKLNAGARFCESCGTAVTGTENPIAQADSGKPILVLRPVFIGWVTALSIIPIQLFMTVWGAGFCGGFGMLAVKTLGLPLPTWFTFVFFGCLFFFGIPIWTYFGKKRAYAKTEYRFYLDRIEFMQGFWTFETKIVRYDQIMETTLRRGFVQRRHNLGTLFLATPATGFTAGKAASGVAIADVEQPEEVYKAVLHLINRRG